LFEKEDLSFSRSLSTKADTHITYTYNNKHYNNRAIADECLGSAPDYVFVATASPHSP